MFVATPPRTINHLVNTAISLDRLREQTQSAFNSLTPRELEILVLVAEGCTNPQVAEQLNLSRLTVQNHRANIRNKLPITNDADYVKLALAFDLIQF